MKRAGGQPDDGVAQDPLTALIRAFTAFIRAVARAETEVLRADLLARDADSRPRGPAHLTIAEAALELRCSQKTVRRMLATGRLHATKLAAGGSSRVLIARAEVARFLAELSP